MNLIQQIDDQIKLVTELLKNPEYSCHQEEGKAVIKRLVRWRRHEVREQRKIFESAQKMLTDEEESAIYYAYKHGEKVKKIARQYHCSPVTAYRAIQKHKKRKII